MTDATTTFNALRPRLQGIAYRMLGSLADAEDVMQDAWLRWHDAAHTALDSAEAWLVTVTTRLSIDRLRAAKARREDYFGFWLPEPVLTDSPATPEEIREFSDDVSVAFLTLLERLSPMARAAFLLREVFDMNYDEVARVLGRTEAGCRQLVRRARLQLREGQPRRVVSREAHRRLLVAFAEVAARGDMSAMVAMLADDVELIGDGGGIVPSFGKVLVGARRIAQLYYATARRFPGAVRIELARINGESALLRFVDGELESAQCYETDGARIVRIHVQRNPRKLARIAATWGRPPHPVS